MAAEWEIKYHPINEPIPEGWVRHDGLDETHHGEFSTFIVKESPLDKLQRLGEEWEASPTLCQCGKPLKTEDRGHHIVALCCGTVLAGCCGDA